MGRFLENSSKTSYLRVCAFFFVKMQTLTASQSDPPLLAQILRCCLYFSPPNRGSMIVITKTCDETRRGYTLSISPLHDHLAFSHQPPDCRPAGLGQHLHCVCVCVFSSHPFWTSSSLDVPAGVTQEEGHTGIFNPPSFCGACLDFCREKDSAIPFPRRP